MGVGEAEPLCVYARVRPPHEGERGDLQVRRHYGRATSIVVRNLEFALDGVFEEASHATSHRIHTSL